MIITCPNCQERQWSIMDKNYVILFGTCWTCDKKRWQEGKLSLAEFEQREEQAVNYKQNEV